MQSGLEEGKLSPAAACEKIERNDTARENLRPYRSNRYMSNIEIIDADWGAGTYLKVPVWFNGRWADARVAFDTYEVTFTKDDGPDERCILAVRPRKDEAPEYYIVNPATGDYDAPDDAWDKATRHLFEVYIERVEREDAIAAGDRWL